MNKAAPWSIKGVDFDARDAAREAARRAGMSLGEWLNDVISEQARDMGVPVEDVDEDGRLEAVTARLASLQGRGRRPGRRGDSFDDDEPPHRRESAGSRPRMPIRETSFDRQRGRRAAEEDYPRDSVANPEALLDAAIRAYERGASRGDKNNAAMSHVARKLEEIEYRLARPVDEPEARHDSREIEKIARLEARLEALARDKEAEKSERSLRSLERRLEEMAGRIEGNRGESTGLAAPVDDIGRIESKLNRLIDTLNPSQARAVEPASRPSAPTSQTRRFDEPQRGAPRLNDAIAQISRRQRELDGAPRLESPRETAAVRRSQPDPAVHALRDDVADLARKLDETHRILAEREAPRPAPAAQPDPAVASLKAEIGLLGRRLEETQQAIVTRIERQARDTHEAPLQPDPAVGAMKAEIAALGRRLEETQQAIVARIERQARSTDQVTPEFDALRRRIDEMARSLGDLAPRHDLVSLEGAVRQLGQNIESSLRLGTPDAILRPIADMTADLRRAVTELAPASGVANIERAIRELGAKIEHGREGAIDMRAVGEIHAQTRDIRDLLQKAIMSPPATESVERQIARLADRLDRPDAANDAVASAPRDAGAPMGMIELLAKRIDDLGRKIDDAVSQSGASDQIDELVRRIDDVQTTLATRMEPTAHVDTSALEGMMRDLAAKLERPAQHALASAAIDTSHIEKMIKAVGARFDSASGGVDAGVIEDLRAEVSNLSRAMEALGKSSVDADVFDDIRRDIAQLAARMETTPAAPTADFAGLPDLRAHFAALEERLDKVDDGRRVLGSMESAITELAHRIEDARHIAVDAAETAARSAAQMTISEALARLPTTTATGEAVPGAITRELADLRDMQESIDRRTHSTLTAVHETLEKVVDRIAVLEEEVGDGRSGAMLATGDAPVFAPASPPPQATKPAFEPASPMVRPPRPMENTRAEPASTAPSFSAAMEDEEEDMPAPPPVAAPRADRLGAPPVAPPASEARRLLDAARRAAQANGEAVAAASAKDSKSSKAARQKESAIADKKQAEARARAEAAQKAWANSSDAQDETRQRIASGVAGKVVHLVGERKYPIIFLIAAGFVAFGSWQLSKRFLPSSTHVETVDQTSDKTSQRATPAPDAATPADAASPAKKQGAMLETPNGDKSAAAKPATDTAPVSSIEPPNGGAPKVGGLQVAAANGDASAQYELGTRFADGRVVVRDPRQAIEWLTRAAQQNLAPAAYRLGSIYERGAAGERNIPKAREWYARAAEAGNIRAMHNMAVLSAEGADGKPDYPTAASWFQQAADYGVRDSQYNLAILYARGLGVEQNLTKSWAWFAIAAAQGDSDAAKKQEDVGARLDSKQLAEAKAIVAAFRPRASVKAANEVSPPPGGWDSQTSRAESRPSLPSMVKPPAKGKVSSL